MMTPAQMEADAARAAFLYRRRDCLRRNSGSCQLASDPVWSLRNTDPPVPWALLARVGDHWIAADEDPDNLDPRGLCPCCLEAFDHWADAARRARPQSIAPALALPPR